MYFEQKRKTKTHIRLEHILSLLEDDDTPCHTEEEVTQESLLAAFPTMKQEQAEFLMTWLKKEARRKAKSGDEAPLKATRPLKRASAWDEEPVMAKFTSFTENGWVTETHQLSGGRDEKISKDDDTNSWDGDAEEIQPAKGISSCVAGDDQNSWDGSGDERAAEALAKTSKVSRSSKAAETLAKASKGSKSSKAS